MKLTQLIPEQNQNFEVFFVNLNRKASYSVDLSTKLWLTENAITKVIKEFQGICTVVVFDKKIDDGEIDLLFSWWEMRKKFMRRFPLDQFDLMLSSCNETQKYSNTFKNELFCLLDQVAIHFDSKIIKGIYDSPEDIPFENIEFVLTGQFLFGEKSAVANLITSQGGKIANSFRSSTDILVVGSKGNVNYTYTSYGEKIKKAIEKRDRNEPILILEENYFFEIYGKSLDEGKIDKLTADT